MIIELEAENTTQRPRVYPCLVEHCGDKGGGSGDWQGVILLALTENKGLVVKAKNDIHARVGMFLDGEDFSKPFWMEYYGRVVMDNRLDAGRVIQTDRKIDPEL